MLVAVTDPSPRPTAAGPAATDLLEQSSHTSSAPTALAREQADRPATPYGLPATLCYAAGWTWRALIVAAGVVGLLYLAGKLHLVTYPLLVALLITALLNPVSARLQRLRVPKWLAVLLTVLLAFAVIGGLGVFVANRASAQYPQLVDQVQTLVNKVQHYLQTGPLHLKQNNSTGDLGDRLVTYLRGRQSQVVSGVVSASKTVAELLTEVVLTFFITIFMLYDGPKIWRWLADLFPRTARPRMDDIGEGVWSALSGYVTGTFIVAVFHATVMGVTLAIVGVPLVAPLAVLILIGSFIPVAGLVIAGAVAVLVTLVADGGGAALVVVIVLVIENQIENHVLQPFVVGRHVRLHPLAIAVTLAVGASVAGIAGALFAVPVVASVNAAMIVLRGSEQEDPPDPQTAPEAVRT